MFKCSPRLYGSAPPGDAANWYLEKAKTEQRNELARHFFQEAVFALTRQSAQQGLTQQNLEVLESWTREHPAFQQWLEPFITCPVGDWQQEHAIAGRERKMERQKQRSEWVSYFRKHLAQIRDGSAPPKILHDLALAYDQLLIDVEGETPRERLNDFLDGDA